MLSTSNWSKNGTVERFIVDWTLRWMCLDTCARASLGQRLSNDPIQRNGHTPSTDMG